MLDNALKNLIKIDMPEHWKTLADKEVVKKTDNKFVNNVMNPVLALRGDDLPVSAFRAGGLFP